MRLLYLAAQPTAAQVSLNKAWPTLTVINNGKSRLALLATWAVFMAVVDLASDVAGLLRLFPVLRCLEHFEIEIWALMRPDLITAPGRKTARQLSCPCTGHFSQPTVLDQNPANARWRVSTRQTCRFLSNVEPLTARNPPAVATATGKHVAMHIAHRYCLISFDY